MPFAAALQIMERTGAATNTLTKFEFRFGFTMRSSFSLVFGKPFDCWIWGGCNLSGTYRWVGACLCVFSVFGFFVFTEWLFVTTWWGSFAEWIRSWFTGRPRRRVVASFSRFWTTFWALCIWCELSRQWRLTPSRARGRGWCLYRGKGPSSITRYKRGWSSFGI